MKYIIMFLRLGWELFAAWVRSWRAWWDEQKEKQISMRGEKRMDGLTVGRMVHYFHNGRHCAAVVTHVWGSNGTVNLHVFRDGSFPEVPETPTSVMFSDTGNLLPGEKVSDGTWHWIEKA